MPIHTSVGLGAVNVPGDVMYVQLLLNDWRSRNAVAPISVDGIAGPKTDDAIKKFQKRFTAVSDGRVDPNGPTIKKLEELHLQGILSGKFGQSIRQYPDVSLASYDPGVVNGIYQNYLKVLRDKLN